MDMDHVRIRCSHGFRGILFLTRFTEHSKHADRIIDTSFNMGTVSAIDLHTVHDTTANRVKLESKLSLST